MVVDQAMLDVVNSIQLHHARLLYIVSELFYKEMITDEQKLALKFGIFNDDNKLMDFYFETNARDGHRVVQPNNNQIFDGEFVELTESKSEQ